MALNTKDFGHLVAAKRGSRGVRVVAAEVGTSHSTLSQSKTATCRTLRPLPSSAGGSNATLGSSWA